jgi:DNA-binding LacI/PurR family transcriptional regulator
MRIGRHRKLSISIKDVAQHAGVSPTTVSLVLNDKGNISDQTRERVLEAVAELGYKRNALGRSLRSQRAYTIGYAQRSQRDALNPLMDHFLYSVADAVEASGWHTLLFNVDQANLVEPYQDLIARGRVDGFILSYTENDDPRFHYLHEVGVPFVAFGRSRTKMDSVSHWVDVDGEAGTFAATQHLIEQGFQAIGFVGWPEGSTAGDDRFLGYQRALETHGIPLNPAWILRVENFAIEGRKAAEQILALDTKPDAIVAVSDVIAIGTQQVFAQAGATIAVTGFDDTPWADFVTPALTSVRQPVRRIASILTDMLIRQIQNQPIETKQHLLQPQLIVRQSSLRQVLSR